MARPLRIEFEDAIYHVCARGNARDDVFRTDPDRLRFVQLLEQSAKRFQGAIFSFVLMNNHVHLLIQTHRPNLSRWMHWLIVTYSVYFNRRHRRSGHLFQGRYKSFLVETGEYLLALSRYVHLNPVRGLTLGQGTPAERRRRLRSFKWSSYPTYAGLSKTFPFVEQTLVLEELDGIGHDNHIAYRRFVEEGLLREVTNPFAAVQWQAVLGSESFLRRIRDQMKRKHHQGREVTALRKAFRDTKPELLLATVAKKLKVEPERLCQIGDRGLRARNLAMWMVWECSGVTLREIGELFGGLDYAAVAQRIRRVRSGYSNKEAQELLERMSNV
jgi:REP element-mobilizing transposase RayT